MRRKLREAETHGDKRQRYETETRGMRQEEKGRRGETHGETRGDAGRRREMEESVAGLGTKTGDGTAGGRDRGLAVGQSPAAVIGRDSRAEGGQGDTGQGDT